MTLSPARALSGILLAALALAVAPSSASAVAAYEGFESPNVGGLGNFRASTPGSWVHEFGTSHTGSSSASAAEPSAMSDERLTHENSYAVSPDAVAPRLSFWHRFQTETGFDGGVLELVVDETSPSALPDDRFVENGPAIALSSGSALAGRKAWTGDSSGFIRTVVDLSAYKGHFVQPRFRFATDATVGGGGWSVDDVSLSGLQRDGGITQFGSIASEPGQSGRVLISPPASACGSAKAYPGKLDSASRAFDLHGYANLNAEPACFDFELGQTGCGDGTPAARPLYVAAYDETFDSTNLSSHFVGAFGAHTDHEGASVDVGAHGQLALDVHQVESETCAGYSLSVHATPPETTIVLGPSGQAESRDGAFELVSTAVGSTFECSLDGAAFAPCGSPHSVTGLALGDHEFRARATDPNGAPDPTPAARKFTVVDPPPDGPPSPGGQPSGRPGQPPGPGTSPDTTKPQVASFTLGRRRFRAATGTTLTYALSEAATAKFTVERQSPGRRAGRRCVKPSGANRRGKRCKRYVALGSFTRPSQSGRNSAKFTGRLSGKRLKPGRYQLVLVATDAAGNSSAPRAAGFTIVR